MPDNTKNEKQRLEAILKQWRQRNSLVPTIMLGVLVMFPFIIISWVLLKLFDTPKIWEPRITLFILQTYLIFFLIPSYFRKRRIFLNSLTSEEIAMLERASHIADKATHKEAQKLLSDRQEVQSDMTKELLRASTEPQDDTLLRAATYTDERAQEQLLRPTEYEQR